jgi:hypothetical protein
MQFDAKEVKNEVPAEAFAPREMGCACVWRRSEGQQDAILTASAHAGWTAFELCAPNARSNLAREDVFARLDCRFSIGWMRRGEADADSGDKIEGRARQRSSTTLYPVESLSSPGREPPFV